MQKGERQALEDLVQQNRLLKHFIDCVAFDTRADFTSKDIPSSLGQLRLGAYVLKYLSSFGLEPIQTNKGVVIAKIPASRGYEKRERLCLLAHMDTAPDCSGANVKPSLVVNYQGQGIELENGKVIDHELCPELENHIGHNIVVTDGTTLLGADDKAGMAVILHLVENLVDDRIVHGPVTVVFSVDEEIGRSSKYIDLEQVDCDFAVTIDGGDIGEFNAETFNAEGVKLIFNGKVVHTAVAYNKLKNALRMASDFMQTLPEDELPESTCGDQGFYHVHDVMGGVDHAEMMMILRDFDKAKLEQRHKFVEEQVQKINERYGAGSCEALFVKQYENMADVLKEKPEIGNYCRQAFVRASIKMNEQKVRGGTDGSNLSCRGLPCPNIFTGALNCHGVYECLPVESLQASYDVVKALVEVVALSGKDRA